MSFSQNTFAQSPFAAEGNVNATISASGIAITSSVGSETISASGAFPVTGVSATMSEGNLGVSLPAVPAIFGEGMTSSVGGVTIVSINNLVMTGIGMTMTLSNQVISKGDALEGVVGAAVTGGLGDESITGTANVDITGIEMTGAIGTVQAAQTATIVQAGLPLTASVESVVVPALVIGPTGIEMTANVGDEAVSLPKDVDVTGTGMTLALAEELIVGDANATIATSDGGTLSMFVGLGTPVIGAGITFTVSGVSASASVGDLFFWDSLETGTDVTWDKVA